MSSITNTPILLLIALNDKTVCQPLLAASKPFYEQVYDTILESKGASYYTILYENFGRKCWCYQAKRNNLRAIKWLHAHDHSCQINNGHQTGMTINDNSVHYEYCKDKAFYAALELGDVGIELIKYLCIIHKPKLTTTLMNNAAMNGHMALVIWFNGNSTDGCTANAMNLAAEQGHLEIVKWLHYNRSEGCTDLAMDLAAENGHLNILSWLHDHGKKCTTYAMDWAAKNGHFRVVKWLHKHRSEGCTTLAMDWAAENGHLQIVEWLYYNRSEGCTRRAMDHAAKNGHLNVVKWLSYKKISGTNLAMSMAADNNHLHVIKWLYTNTTAKCSIYWTMEGRRADVTQYLTDHNLLDK